MKAQDCVGEKTGIGFDESTKKKRF